MRALEACGVSWRSFTSTSRPLDSTSSIMTRTRASARLQAGPRSEIDDDETADAGRAAPSAAFKAGLKRFRHEDGATEESPSGVTNASYSVNAESSHGALVSGNPRGPDTKRVKADTTTSAKKRRRVPSSYAPPSTYAHLQPLTDILEPNLICIFVGTNPGIATATAGHAYAHPSNLFWKLLHSSGCTDERLKPEQDVELPRLYSMGNTNIVERASRNAAELSKAEMAAGTPVLEAKIRKFKPEAVCIVGKGIWEAVWRWRYGREIKRDEFRYGWQDDRERMGRVSGDEDEETWEGSPVFVASSTSGLSASLRPPEKEAIWKPFGNWVREKREQRRLETSANKSNTE